MILNIEPLFLFFPSRYINITEEFENHCRVRPGVFLETQTAPAFSLFTELWLRFGI